MRWPTLFNGVDSTLEDWVVEQMHIVGPPYNNYTNLMYVNVIYRFDSQSDNITC